MQYAFIIIIHNSYTSFVYHYVYILEMMIAQIEQLEREQ